MAMADPSTNIPSDAADDFKLFLRRFRTTSSLTRKQQQQFENTTIDDVKAVIASIEQNQISKNRQLWLRRLEPFLASMEQYGKVIEVFLNASEILSFVWGPMKFMLTVRHKVPFKVAGCNPDLVKGCIKLYGGIQCTAGCLFGDRRADPTAICLPRALPIQRIHENRLSINLSRHS
jgi:hypothetical protein